MIDFVGRARRRTPGETREKFDEMLLVHGLTILPLVAQPTQKRLWPNAKNELSAL
jgi:hypothetical protein